MFCLGSKEVVPIDLQILRGELLLHLAALARVRMETTPFYWCDASQTKRCAQTVWHPTVWWFSTPVARWKQACFNLLSHGGHGKYRLQEREGLRVTDPDMTTKALLLNWALEVINKSAHAGWRGSPRQGFSSGASAPVHTSPLWGSKPPARLLAGLTFLSKVLHLEFQDQGSGSWQVCTHLAGKDGSFITHLPQVLLGAEGGSWLLTHNVLFFFFFLLWWRYWG